MTLPAGTYYQDDRYLEDGSKRYIDQQLAQILERNFTEANRYDQNSAGVALANGTPPLFNQSPRTGTANYSDPDDEHVHPKRHTDRRPGRGPLRHLHPKPSRR